MNSMLNCSYRSVLKVVNVSCQWHGLLVAMESTCCISVVCRLYGETGFMMGS